MTASQAPSPNRIVSLNFAPRKPPHPKAFLMLNRALSFSIQDVNLILNVPQLNHKNVQKSFFAKGEGALTKHRQTNHSGGIALYLKEQLRS